MTPPRVVIDTNVLISALLKPGSVPDRALTALWASGAMALYDDRILAEYREVAARPKFRAVPHARTEALFVTLQGHGERLEAVAGWSGAMADESDRIFVEVALAGRADALVTGNLKHYPPGLGFELQPPATLLARLLPLDDAAYQIVELGLHR
jgi:putative PIN family toxin of toxin-antitoxin system